MTTGVLVRRSIRRSAAPADTTSETVADRAYLTDRSRNANVRIVPTATANGIELTYVEDGDPNGDPLLLVMGFTAQLTSWPQGFVDLLGSRGYRVIRHDNRDCGLSTKLDGVRAEPMKLLAGDPDAVGCAVPARRHGGRLRSGFSTISASRRPTSSARRWAA